MYTVREIAQRMKCSTALVYLLCSEGKLKHHRLGLGRGTIRVTEEQLLAFLQETESRGETHAPPAALRDLKFRGSVPS
jgi:excisionase family DNA binding protein